MEAVRVAEAEDVEAFHHLVTGVLAELTSWRGGSLWRAQNSTAIGKMMAATGFGELLDDPGRLLLVGTLDGVTMGMAAGRIERLPDGRSLGHLDGCFVEPGARGVGLGRLLADTIITWLQDHDCVGVDGTALPGDREAKNFFEGSGFKARLLVMHRSFE
ncbi:MAG: GNAT family N-acetyltransferase [Acidimicrobiales bacterium]